MMPNSGLLRAQREQPPQGWKWALILPACLLLAVAARPAHAAANLLKNPGFEEAEPGKDIPVNWVSRSEGAKSGTLIVKEAHSGRQCVAIPADTAVEQRVERLEAGAYLARCWVKSQAEQPVTLLLQEPDRPWAAYTCAEVTVPRDRWVQVEAFCSLDRPGTLILTLGGTSTDFRFYHGTPGEMAAPILADDCELVRYQPDTPPVLAVWDAREPLAAKPQPLAKQGWSPVEGQSHTFAGTPVFRDRQVVELSGGPTGGWRSTPSGTRRSSHAES